MGWTTRRTNVSRTGSTRSCASWAAPRASVRSPRSPPGASRPSAPIGRASSRRWSCSTTPSSCTTCCGGSWPSRRSARAASRRLLCRTESDTRSRHVPTERPPDRLLFMGAGGRKNAPRVVRRFREDDEVSGGIRRRGFVDDAGKFPEAPRARSGNSVGDPLRGIFPRRFMGSPNCSPVSSIQDVLARRVHHMMRSIVESSLKVRFLVVVACTWLALSGGGVMAQEKKIEDFNPKSFDGRSTTIDNEWFPLKPGTRLVYAGTTIEDDGKAVPRRLVSIVTDLTKVIGGVRTVIVWDVDYKDGQLSETEIAFFAQDNDGNVWLLGEYPEEWEGGKFLKAPVWLHGREEARAGIAMQAKPQLGTPSYAQGWGPAVKWTDRATVDQMGQKTCVRTGCYDDVLVIA